MDHSTPKSDAKHLCHCDMRTLLTEFSARWDLLPVNTDSRRTTHDGGTIRFAGRFDPQRRSSGGRCPRVSACSTHSPRTRTWHYAHLRPQKRHDSATKTPRYCHKLTAQRARTSLGHVTLVSTCCYGCSWIRSVNVGKRTASLLPPKRTDEIGRSTTPRAVYRNRKLTMAMQRRRQQQH